MHPLLAGLTTHITFSGQISANVDLFLRFHGCEATAMHCAAVAGLSGELAGRFGLEAQLAHQAGWLHDVSAVVPNTARIRYARELGLHILPEEMQLPMILHQKLSRIFASEIFGVTHPGILDAVTCHTTLKAGATLLDKAVFIADKLAWDQSGTPPYADAMQHALKKSLDAAACVYLSYLWDRKESLPVIHPWLVDAVQDLCAVVLE